MELDEGTRAWRARILALLALTLGCSGGPSAPRPPEASPSSPSGGSVGSGTARPAPAPISRTRDTLVVAVRGVGVVRYSGGRFERMFDLAEPIVDLDIGPSVSGATDALYVLSGSHTYVIERGVTRTLPVIAGWEGVHRISVTPGGVLVGITGNAFARLEGDAWTAVPVTPPAGWPLDSISLRGLSLGRFGDAFLFDPSLLFEQHRHALRSIRIPGRPDENHVGIASRGAELVVLQNHHVHRRGADFRWTSTERPLGDLALRTVAIGADGTIVAGAIDSIVELPRSGPARSLELATIGVDVGWIHDIARDSGGQTWIVSDRTIAVLSPELELVEQWSTAIPEIGGAVEHIRVLAAAP